ncbi:MAG: 50S ribosomal protein L13 [Gammaproteobacteria bacterium]|mgnify:FL=1|nr:50S ribosomal protein L13 [Gammaproteobacteria bacterium]MCH2641634.1 50S ribosomal protein L13 [Candidatus Thalassarchaeum sp.]GIS44115.1 MAG: 50S ribosomal protein L13 [Candidatus Poseidoniales archaeon]
MAEATTFVYNAEDKVLGRLASVVAKQLITAKKAGEDTRVIIVNAEKAIVTGKRSTILSDYRAKYELNHPRKGPFFPRMPDQILKRTVRGMLPYQKNSSGRNALRSLRVEIGTPSDLSGDLPDGCEWGDSTKIDRPLPERFVRLGEISKELGVKVRWEAE